MKYYVYNLYFNKIFIYLFLIRLINIIYKKKVAKTLQSNIFYIPINLNNMEYKFNYLYNIGNLCSYIEFLSKYDTWIRCTR